MLIVRGRNFYGKVDDVDGVHVATLFSHVWAIPIYPVTSYLIFPEGSSLHDVGVGWAWRSILTGYLRAWCPILMIGALVAYSTKDGAPWSEQPWEVALFSVVGLVSAYTWLHRASPTRRAQRRIYGAFAGCPVDVALLYGQRDALRVRLHRELHDRRVQEVGSYRGEAVPREDWIALALSPEMRDETFLHAALTLARLDEGEAKGEDAKALARAHAAIWAKLEKPG